MNSRLFSYLLLLLLALNTHLVSHAQYGYSPFIDSLVQQIDDSTISLLTRQLSGDTTVLISGVTDSIKSRHTNYADNSKAAQFILQKFQSFGIPAYIQQYDPNGQNVVATLVGSVYPNQQFVVCAHYDNMPSAAIAPGADDNASGITAMLEAARLMSNYSFPYTVKFVAFDEEEQGLIGSQAYADSAFLMGHQILGVFNQDMIAWDANNDFEYSVSVNTASLAFLEKHVDNIKIYQPILAPSVITIGSSDHYRFWAKGYPALLSTEQYQVDFNSYYHTVQDNFDNLNMAYYLAMTRGVVASVLTMASDYKMSLSHQPIESDMVAGERIAKLIVTGPHQPDLDVHKPRLYYRLDEGEFGFTEQFTVSGDTINFVMPDFPLGTKVSYYFAVQDSEGDFVVTLPEYGKGMTPPGLVPPPTHYSYYILEDTTATFCAGGLPLAIPANSTTNKTISVPDGGRILDLNVKVSLNHTSTRDINLYLVSPSGREIILSTKNGFISDHYINTVFDDEASLMITQSLPPYTGSFRPEGLLEVLQDTTLHGTWTLKIVNTGSVAGSLTAFCLIFDYSGGCQYVDVSRPVSGDGQTWETALTSISEAVSANPEPGSVVFIKPGLYEENLVISTNGQQVIPLSTGVSVSEGNKIQFPDATDLSGLDLERFPGKYYAYVYRSRYLNNGYYQVFEVNDALNYIRVHDAYFMDETGNEGDSTSLSAIIGLPVIYRKYSPNPEEERVILDSITIQDPAIYLGDPVGDGHFDANPANFNIIDGIDICGRSGGIALQVQGSSYNVVCNSKIYDSDSIAVYINGNSEHPSNFNVISGNQFIEFPSAAVKVGYEALPAYNNHAHFNHFIGNEFRSADTAIPDISDHVLVINHYNHYNVFERNSIHDINIGQEGNGLLEVMDATSGTRVNGNIVENIGGPGSGQVASIRVHAYSDNTRISNNIICNLSGEGGQVYAFRLDGSSAVDCRLAHNTIYNVDRAFMLEDDGLGTDFGVYNNIVMANGLYIDVTGNDGAFTLSHNLFFTDPSPVPGMPYDDEPGRQVGQVEFVNAAEGDFRLTISSEKAICNGLSLAPPIGTDINGNPRSPILPDIGACELENKVIWLGTYDQEWNNAQNWSTLSVPDPASNTVILGSGFTPLISTGDAESHGILLKPGTLLRVSGFNLHISEN